MSKLSFIGILCLCLSACGGGGNKSSHSILISSASNNSSSSTSTANLSFLAGGIGGLGSVDGKGNSARFNQPYSVAVDTMGNVYVADYGNYTIRKITPDGTTTTLAGLAGVQGSADGKGTAAQFFRPTAIAVDINGNLYVSDSGNYTIRKITAAGEVTTLAGTIHQPGLNDSADNSTARFYSVNNIAVDASGTLYITDNTTIRKITITGIVTTLAGKSNTSGNIDAKGTAARFGYLGGIAIDASGNLLVADITNRLLRKMTPSGDVTTFAVTGECTLCDLRGISISAEGNIYATGQTRVYKVTSAGVVSIVAGAAYLDNVDDTGTAASFNNIRDVAVDTSGNLYIADTNNNLIRKITPATVVTTLAGSREIRGVADGAGNMTTFGDTTDITPSIIADTSGNLFLTDSNNSTIRKISMGEVTTFSGSAGTCGFTDGSEAAEFCYPKGIAIDAMGNLFVADTYNNAIRKITPAGEVSTVAGSARGSVDATGTDAQFFYPTALTFDSAGNLYIVDQQNMVIRKMTPAGVVTTFAGQHVPESFADGTGTAARFLYVTGITLGSDGNLYVTDAFTVRRIAIADAKVTTIAGDIMESFGDTNGSGAAVRFNGPEGITADSVGNLYVADTGNHLIRKIKIDGAVTTTVVGQSHLGGFVPGSLPGVIASPKALAISGNTLFIVMDNAVVKVTPLP